MPTEATPDDRAAGHRRRIVEAPNRFPCDASDGHQQEHRVGQRRENRGAAEAVGAPRGRRRLHQVARPPREDQAKDIAEVVTRVGQQREGVRQKNRRWPARQQK